MPPCRRRRSGRPAPAVHSQKQLPVRAVESNDRACGFGRRCDRISCKSGLRMLLQIDASGGLAVAECQMRTELAGECPHRLVLRAGGDPQEAVTLRPRLGDQLSEQDAADALASHAGLDAESDLRQRIRGLIRRMELRRAAYHAVLDVRDDDGAVVSAFGGIAFDEIIIHEAVKAIMPALPIEPQKVIAE